MEKRGWLDAVLGLGPDWRITRVERTPERKELRVELARAVMRAAWKLSAHGGKARIEGFGSWVEKQRPGAARGACRRGAASCSLSATSGWLWVLKLKAHLDELGAPVASKEAAS